MAKKENGASSKRAHFNVIDAVIIILVIAVALGIYSRFNVVETLWAKNETEKYAVSFSVKDIRYTTATYVNVGDKVYFTDNDELFGAIMSESEDNVNALGITPSSKYFTDSEGKVVEVFYPSDTRIDVKGRIECMGYYNGEGGFTVDGRKYLAPGQTVEVRTELVTVTITVTSIDLIEE
ncbi:MAG: DUF4330 family protein [Clostridia bacterium]|nr:DUF4330 family protein [Clostridia bacterium]